MNEKTHTPINFSPFATNVIDCVGRTDLQTPQGEDVKILRSGNGDFIIKIDNRTRIQTGDNLRASYFLNARDIGYLA